MMVFNDNGKKKYVPQVSAPWYTVHRKLKKLFKGDPEVKVSPLDGSVKEEDGKYTVYISCNNAEKLSAIEKLIKTEYDFGGVRMNIKFTAKDGDTEDWEKILKTAFTGNTNVTSIVAVPDLFDEYYYVIFEDKVVQFYNDEMWDCYGNWNGLYTDIAKDVFKDNPFIKFSIKRIK